MLIKKSSPRGRAEDFSNLIEETLVVPKNKTNKSTYFFPGQNLRCLHYLFWKHWLVLAKVGGKKCVSAQP